MSTWNYPPLSLSLQLPVCLTIAQSGLCRFRGHGWAGGAGQHLSSIPELSKKIPEEVNPYIVLLCPLKGGYTAGIHRKTMTAKVRKGLCCQEIMEPGG